MEIDLMNKAIIKFGRRLRLGVLGGGPGSFIGEVHRRAARLDDNFEIVAAVLSSDPERSRSAGQAIGLPIERTYGTAEDLFEQESARPDGMDVAAVMTPNDSHHRLCCMAIGRGLDVICDKPLTTTLSEALDLVGRVRESGVVLCQSFNYTGYPLVRQARAMVRDGDLGEIRMVQVEYVQGRLAGLVEGEAEGKASSWRMSPAKTGASLVLCDIGSHAHHMICFVTGLQVARLCTDIGTVVPGRNVDDYAAVLFRLDNGAPGVMWLTQAGAGAVHGLRFRVFGERGGLEWIQEQPNQLHFSRFGKPAIVFERDGPGLKPEALRAGRTAIGHPEGYQEAFATLYDEAATAIVARRLGDARVAEGLTYPRVEDGARTMKFIEAALESARAGGWVECLLKL